MTGVNSAHQPILIAGAIGDHGIATSETKSGKVDQNGSYVHIALKKGTFFVDATKLNGSPNGKAVVQNKTSCSFAFKVTGPITISDGTGAYQGNQRKGDHDGRLRGSRPVLHIRSKEGPVQHQPATRLLPACTNRSPAPATVKYS